MAWNEPGNDNKDPWGNRNNNGDGPPNFDEIIRNLFGKFGGNKKNNNNSQPDGGSFFVPILAIALFFGILIYAWKGFDVVNEQERAVVLRFGVYVETKGPGWRWNPPLIDQVFTENVTRVRAWSTSEQMLTEDLNIVDVKLSVQYSIADAEAFVLHVRDPEESLKQAASSALRHVVGSVEMHRVLTEGRAEMAIDVRDRLREYLDSYSTGILVDKVNIEDSNPPREVQDAFDNVIKAREDEERFQNEAQSYANSKVPDAEGEAARMVEAANAYKEEIVARAEGEANRFELLLDEYNKAPKVTRERLYLSAMEEVMSSSSKIMVDVKGGNNMMYLPLDKLVDSNNLPAGKATRALTRQELDQITQQVKSQILSDLPVSTSRRSAR